MVTGAGKIHRQGGFMMTEMGMAMLILALVMVPLGFSINLDGRLFRATYQRSVAMEIVDGELEILAAGDWHNFSEGTHLYAVTGNAVNNLPPGQFSLTRIGTHLRLEWKSVKKLGIGPVMREVTVK